MAGQTQEREIVSSVMNEEIKFSPTEAFVTNIIAQAFGSELFSAFQFEEPLNPLTL